MTDGIIYSPRRKAFVNRPGLAFRAEDYTDVNGNIIWLVTEESCISFERMIYYLINALILFILFLEMYALAELLGAYGMKYLGERMMQQIASQVGELKVYLIKQAVFQPSRGRVRFYLQSSNIS
jgi:hypothetical protein